MHRHPLYAYCMFTSVSLPGSHIPASTQIGTPGQLSSSICATTSSRACGQQGWKKGRAGRAKVVAQCATRRHVVIGVVLGMLVVCDEHTILMFRLPAGHQPADWQCFEPSISQRHRALALHTLHSMQIGLLLALSTPVLAFFSTQWPAAKLEYHHAHPWDAEGP